MKHRDIATSIRLLRSLSASQRSPRVRQSIDTVVNHITELEEYATLLRNENRALRERLTSLEETGEWV